MSTPNDDVAVGDSLERLSAAHEQALDLLQEFTERFYWIKDHPDYQASVRKYLEAQGRESRPYGH